MPKFIMIIPRSLFPYPITFFLPDTLNQQRLLYFVFHS